MAAEAAAVVGGSETVVGLDPSTGMLHRARARPRVTLVVRGVVPGLPFADGSFDVVLINLVLSHVPVLAEAVADVARALRRGGRFGATAWAGEPEDEDDRDGPAASGVVRSVLEECSLPVSTPVTGAPHEDWLRDPANLRTLLEDADLTDVETHLRVYRRALQADEFLAWSEWAGLLRYVRTVADPARWDEFRRRALDELGARFPQAVRSVGRVWIVVATKPP